MIELKKATTGDVDVFVGFESDADTRQFILPYSAEKHHAVMRQPDVIYLAIMQAQEVAGFIILALDGDDSVEFRRIVVGSKGAGIGQAAILAMEQYCRVQLARRRVWLDVFDANDRGKYIYQKLGYQPFATDNVAGQTLLLMEKWL
ncbi:GNAT family N-acetyltransferase [Photobacterium sp. TY1-4]|uniref:GNAT family N-acetyltransferase n=1 Tax=Photobacterium sp. TY1-4 TaxID=2899122 RepID=UPI0021BF8CBB|nr:GNAT family N-acetyltransferase [Photobacterium sp. TY1-4]UXI04259.1 GNAT family N-acetyltransferase [Photobacterium sp. TY1-4]